MKNSKQHSLKTFLFFLTLALFVFTLPAISQNTGAVKLLYNYPADSPVKYLSTSKMVQDMDINGQIMSVNIAAILGCTVKSKGIAENNLVLEITIDTLSQTVDSPGGLSGGALKEAIGKVFIMKILPTGKETDLSGAEQITFTDSEGGSNSVKDSFTDFFPDLPAEAINPGYTWSGTDTLSTKSSTTNLEMIVKADNKFEGYEQINGINCAKITFALSGTRLLKTQTQGMDVKMNGPFTGTGELYFALDKGYFLKQIVKTRMTGQIEISSPEVMSFPVTMDQNSVTEVKN
jgi:hypothetical protein